jgi:hypothetical protein
LIYFCWVGEPQLQIYQGVFILSIAKAFYPLAEPVDLLSLKKQRLFSLCFLMSCFLDFDYVIILIENLKKLKIFPKIT